LRGFLSLRGSHTLEKFANQVARDVQDPQTGVSVAERARARLRIGGDKGADTRSDLRLGLTGMGSDYSTFINHIGMATLHLGFGGEGDGGSNHSVFDSYDYYTRFGDPGFDYGITLAKTAGRMTLRFANADLLPFTFTNFVDNVGKFVNEVVELGNTMREQTERHNTLVAADAFSLAADPTKRFIPPEAREPVPQIDFAPLQSALAMLEESAEAYDAALRESGAGLDATSREALNDVLQGVEHAMTRTEGLPGRPWYRHHVYAPHPITGYSGYTLPRVRNAIEQRDWEAVAAQVRITAEVLQNVVSRIEAATAVINGS